MCNPVALGLALSVAGGAVRGVANRRYVNNLNTQEQIAYARSKDAREAEIERQQAWEAQAADYWGTATDALDRTGYDQTHDQAVAEYLDTYDGLPSEAGAPGEGFLLSGQENGASEIKDTIMQKTNAAAAEARARIASLASLSSHATTGAGRGLMLGDNANLLQTLNNVRQGSLGVSRFEQSIPPATVNPPTYLLADILSGAGAVTSGVPDWRRPAASAPINLLEGIY